LLNLENYEECRRNFCWEDVDKEFSWYKTGKVNIAYECMDRNVNEKGLGDKNCMLYSDDLRDEAVTFSQMKTMSNKFGNVLKKYGIKKGDRVFIFMPRSPELYASLLGVVKIGAIVGPLFEAFMAGAVKDRLQDSEAIAIVTTPKLKERILKEELPNLKYLFLVGEDVPIDDEKDVNWNLEMAQASEELAIEWVDKKDPMLLLYTSGSTGKPKGVVHVHGGMPQHLVTGRWILDFKENDIYWCTADPGWVTGISYGVWSPWLNGLTCVVRGGRFDADDWYATIEKYKVNLWYSAPTAFRMLMAGGDETAKKHDLSSLRHIASAGEPLNPEVIRWALKAFDVKIHDNWWMTETGAMIMSNYLCLDIRPGSMGKPVPGIDAAIIDDEGNVLPPNQMGNLAIKAPWPSIMSTIWGNEEKYQEYFRHRPWYISGDSAYMDEDGYYWFQGRVDDVINTAGERVGPFEVESKLVEHPAVAEAGVIGKPDPLRGEIIKAFISLREGFEWSEELGLEIRNFVKNSLAAHAAPREIEVKDRLPKTRSGKIMRRVLKAWELGLPTGDLSTLED